VDKVQRKKITSVKVFFFGAKMKQIILKHKLIFQELKNLRIFTRKKILLEICTENNLSADHASRLAEK
jgi:hypothetical protein